MDQANKFAAWAIGIIFLSIGVWCLALTAKSATLALSAGGADGMPIDMRMMAIISSAVAVIFSFLFLFSGGTSVLRSKITQPSYYPTLPKVAILVVLIALSVLARAEYQPTTKITWEEARGLPFPFLTLTEIRGPCNAGIAFWTCRSFENLSPLVWGIDVLMAYGVICVVVQILFELSTFDSRRRRVT